MLLAGLVDLGLPLSAVWGALQRLGLPKRALAFRRIRFNGIRAGQVWVDPKVVQPMLPREGGQILDWIEHSRLLPIPKAKLSRVMRTLACAEGRVHGLPWRKIRFHQVGGLDTWVNFLGLIQGLVHFRIAKLFVSVIPIGAYHEGHDGRRRLSPGPATLHLLAPFQTILHPEPFEWTTPTAAALLSTCASSKPAPPFWVERVGHGAGHRVAPSGQGLLRLLLGIPHDST